MLLSTVVNVCPGAGSKKLNDVGNSVLATSELPTFEVFFQCLEIVNVFVFLIRVNPFQGGPLSLQVSWHHY